MVKKDLFAKEGKGPKDKTYIIAEIGINHNGKKDLAIEMIEAAAKCGADAVKFQNYETEDFITDKNILYTYKSKEKDITESQYEMFKRCELNFEWLKELKNECDRVGVDFVSTPTGKKGVEQLMELGADYIKNGSDYLGNLDIIKRMAESGIPTILSTGMAREEEVNDAVNTFYEAGGRELVLLACTSAYPAPKESLNLLRIKTLGEKYRCKAGFSDHSIGCDAAVAAACMGAKMIEKHFTTNKNYDGPDHWFSASPEELKELIYRVREVEIMMGSERLEPSKAEIEAREKYRLSCVASRELEAGVMIKREHIVFQRPGNGISPKDVGKIIGKKLIKNILKNEVMRESDFQ